MKKLFNLFLFFSLFVILVASGCAGLSKTPTQASPCFEVTADQSYICSIIPNPQDVSFILQLANVAAMKENVYQAKKALKVVDTLIMLLEPGTIKYNELFELVQVEVDPLLFVVVSEYQPQFGALDTLILPYDMNMILTHLKKQRVLIAMAL